MAEMSNTIIAALIILIIIFVMGVVFNEQSSEIFSIIIDSFDKVFVVDDEAEATSQTVASFEKLFSNIEDYCYGGFNTIAGTDCLCYSQTLGTVSESSFYLIQNSYSQGASAVSVLNALDNTYEARETKPYTLGLFVSNKNAGSNYELGCIFPDNFQILGNYQASINHLYLYWQDERTDKWPNEQGADYTFEFYEDKKIETNVCLGWPPACDDTSSYSYTLKAAPIFYKIDDTKICILTEMIERPIEIYSSDNFHGFGISVGDRTEVTNFFRGSDVTYCHNIESVR
ncbi:hypothetical protein HON03_01620 [archaeon]|nr:hypothetical protein [archaeon]MBT5288515.1 hypothetical protein [archaeon]